MSEEILKEITDIATSRPELTTEEWLIVEKAAPYYKALLKPEIRQELEADYAEKYAQFQEESQAQLKTLVQAKFDEWRKSQEPLTTDDLKKLLSQAYDSFPVKIFDQEKQVERIFTIRELPKSVEQRFLELAQRSVLPYLEHKSLANFKLKFDSSFASTVGAILQLIPASFDIAAELAAICLDPFQKEAIDAAWVSANLSSQRIQAILLIQFEANKYRDFLSHAFRWFQSLTNRTTM